MSTPPLFPHALGQPGFVLTVFVALVWVSRQRVPTSYPYDVAVALLRTAAVVPESFPLDLAEVVVHAERAGQITSVQSAANLALINGYPVFVDHQTHFRAWNDILGLARAHSISVRDAAYLELALRLNLPLATTDAALTRVAPTAGVAVFAP